jgi:hypothetical protein
MNYDFTLDRKGMFSVMASSVLLGALMFVAGLIVGSYWTANGPTASAAATKKNTMAANDSNALPQQPVLINELPAVNLTAPDKATANPASVATGRAQLTAPPASQAAAPPPQTGADQAATAPEQGGDNKQTNQPASDAAAPPTEKPADSIKQTQGANEDLVTVEVGTFLDANVANRLYKTLERKGYAPSFFIGLDAQARQWYSIRIGAYSDKQQAENAAANFTKQEKMKAAVRPLGSL